MKQSVQLPRALGIEFREVAGEMGHGGVKILGTAAIAIVLGMSADDRKALCNYVWQKTRDDVDSLEKERVIELVRMILMNQEADIVPVIEPVWAVDEINQDLQSRRASSADKKGER